MPIYNYQCQKCNSHFEAVRSLHDTSAQPCNKCKNGDAIKFPCAIGGYKIKGNNSASTRPRRSGSFKK
jgi:putative FmdB family regulatory protein